MRVSTLAATLLPISLAVASPAQRQEKRQTATASSAIIPYSNPATNFLTETNSLGVVTGQPTQPAVVTVIASISGAPSIPAGFTDGVYTVLVAPGTPVVISADASSTVVLSTITGPEATSVPNAPVQSVSVSTSVVVSTSVSVSTLTTSTPVTTTTKKPVVSTDTTKSPVTTKTTKPVVSTVTKKNGDLTTVTQKPKPTKPVVTTSTKKNGDLTTITKKPAGATTTKKGAASSSSSGGANVNNVAGGAIVGVAGFLAALL